MNQGLIPRRYAKALYKTALDRGCAAQEYEYMKTLCRSFDEFPDMQATAANPFISVSDKARLFTTAAGASDDKTFADFLRLLAENRRIDLIHLIAIAYMDIYRKANNIRRVEVVSAVPLDDAVMQRIRDVIKQHTGGAAMEFSSRVDPSIIGGFIVNIDNDRLDASLDTRLKELRLSLLS